MKRLEPLLGSLMGALVCASLGLPACQSCEHDKPYTPFKVATGRPGGAPATPTPTPTLEADAGAPAFTPRRSELAPKSANSWRIGDQDLKAPLGYFFDQAVQADFNADGRLETVAWLTPVALVAAGNAASPAPSPPSAWLFETNSPPRLLTQTPGFLPGTADCQTKAALSQTGEHTLTLDLHASCQAPLLPRSPTRAVIILAPFSQRVALLTLRFAAPPPGETLDVSVDSTDQDGDQRDDVKLSVRVAEEADPSAAITAPLLWLDRALGLARNPSEPAQSIAKAASLSATRAPGKTTSRHTAPAVRALIRYYSSVCAESGTYRITQTDGSALPCGDLGKTALRLTQARFRSALRHKSYLEALAALTTSNWFLGSVDARDLKPLAQEFSKSLPQRRARRVPIFAQARAISTAPHFSPLTFDSSGALLLLTETGVARISSEGVAEALEVDAGVAGASVAKPQGAEWPLLVSSAALSWTGITHSCDSPLLALALSAAPGVPAAPVPTRFLAPRPGTCAGGKEPNRLHLSPLAFTNGKLFALLGAMLVEPPGEHYASLPALPGSPRSADGKQLVVPSPYGLLIQDEMFELWSPDPPTDLAQLSHCVIQNGAQRVACLDAGKPVLFEPQGALARSK